MTDVEQTSEPEVPDEIVVKLHEEAGLPEAEEFLQTCIDLPIDKNIVFDASDVTIISTPYILTLSSTLMSRADSSPKVALKSAPQVLIDGFQDLGLFESMMKMEFQ